MSHLNLVLGGDDEDLEGSVLAGKSDGKKQRLVLAKGVGHGFLSGVRERRAQGSKLLDKIRILIDSFESGFWTFHRPQSPHSRRDHHFCFIVSPAIEFQPLSFSISTTIAKPWKILPSFRQLVL